jgi:predicted NAD/FAD-binding protein
VDAIRAQGQVNALQGQGNTYFCGAWTGYGFHEDGLKSGLAVAERLLAEIGVPR